MKTFILKNHINFIPHTHSDGSKYLRILDITMNLKILRAQNNDGSKYPKTYNDDGFNLNTS